MNPTSPSAARKRTALVRHLIQLAAFLVFPDLFVLTFAYLGELVHALLTLSFSVPALIQQILLVASVGIVTALFGRFFCGYLCSFGAAGDLFWKLGRLLKLPRLRPDAKTDRLLRRLKYLLLGVIAVFSWGLGYALPDAANPWSVFGQLAVIGSVPAFSALLSLGGALLAGILVLSLLGERFFCRYLCPLGAALSLASRARLFRIRKPRARCGSCRACSAVCPMGLDLSGTDRVTSGECINCLSCAQICPRANVRVDPSPAISAAVALGAMSSFYFAGSLTASAASASSVASAAQSAAESGTAASAADGTALYADGTYTGSAEGYRGMTTVSVTVSGGVITAVDVVSYEDNESFFVRAEQSVIADILASQSTDVDTVAGATFSSNGIIDAVANALNSASAGSAVTQSSGDSAETAADAGTAQSGTETSAATQSSSDSAETAADAGTAQSGTETGTGSSTFADGTYTGSGTGLRGETTVSVTVSGGAITDITVVSYADDEAFFSRAESTVIQEILSAQSTDVATVAGATYSSNGILEAVADALGVDFTNPNASMTASAGGRHH